MHFLTIFFILIAHFLFYTVTQPLVYTNDLKDREFIQKVPQRSYPIQEAVFINTPRESDKTFEETPTLPKTDSSDCLSIEEVLSFQFTISDMDRSVDFYTNVLTFEKIEDFETSGASYQQLTGLTHPRMRVVKMKLGNEFLSLVEYLDSEGMKMPKDTKSNDQWFQHLALVVKDMNQAYQVLQKNHVIPISKNPQKLPKWNKAAADIEAFYFKDPDGHPLEIIFFPPGKGLEKWHKNTKGIFLGIDHSAIAVQNTERSLAFYQKLLRLKIVGKSCNYGKEQERLSDVLGACVRITSLRANTGPGIELLEYVNPKNGRPFPTHSKPNDIWYAQINMRVEDVGLAYKKIQDTEYEFISKGLSKIPLKGDLYREEFIIKDPDGHALLIE